MAPSYALLQRRKNRGLFDLAQGPDQVELDMDKLAATFDHYLTIKGNPITLAAAKQRLLAKLTRNLTEDIVPLLQAGTRFDEGRQSTPAHVGKYARLIACFLRQNWDNLTAKTCYFMPISRSGAEWCSS